MILVDNTPSSVMNDSPSRAAGDHQYPVKRSNSSCVTNVATPADLGSSFGLSLPGIIKIIKTQIHLKSQFRAAGTSEPDLDVLF